MAIADTISSMYENVGEVYDTITNVDVNNGKNLISSIDIFNGFPVRNIGSVVSYQTSANSITYKKCAYVEANKTYTLSWDYATPKATGDRDIIICDENNIELEYFNYTNNNNNKKRTFTPTHNGWIYAALDTNAIKVQLELGSSATEYQPYTDNPTYKNIENIPSTIRKSYLDIMNNGIDTIYDNWEKVNGTGTSLTLNNTEEAPMTIEYKGNTSQGENPTPTTPQDIHIVSGDNSIMVSNSDNTQSQTYPIYLPVENYLPNNATTQTINGITYTINEDKSIKINGTASGRADMYLYGSNTDTGNYTYIPKGTYTIDTSNLLDGTMFLQFREKTAGIVYQTKQNNGLLTLLSQQDCYFYGIMLAVESGKTINNLTFYPQIEKGTKLNSYTPYGTTPIELCKIGTYQDYIFRNTTENPLYDSNLEEGQWYIHKEIGSVVLNGSETYSGGNVATNVYRFYRAIDGIKPYTDSSRHIDRFITNRFNLSINNEFGATYQYQGNLYFCVSSNEATTYNEFRTWLSTHNLEVYYVLNTPTYEKITGELLNQLEAIKKSYENQTNINQENNDLPFELEVGALEKY